jgi:acetyltransferase-like isoleucine patch superfamily enzyme
MTSADDHGVSSTNAAIRDAVENWRQRLGDPRNTLRALIAEVLLPANQIPRSLVFAALRFAGYDLAESCGLRAARIETSELRVGAGTVINRRLWIQGRGPVSIGERGFIGPDVLIVTSTHARDVGGRLLPNVDLPVEIGDDCFIGARAQLLPGVTVGSGVTVAAGGVVVADIGPGGLYGGVPARRLD